MQIFFYLPILRKKRVLKCCGAVPPLCEDKQLLFFAEGAVEQAVFGLLFRASTH